MTATGLFEQIARATAGGQRGLAGLRRAGASRSGNVAVEFAAVLAFLPLLVFGIFDFGRYAMTQAGVTAATRAGTQYALQAYGASLDPAAIAQAVRLEAGAIGDTLDVQVREYATCDGTTEVASGTVCPDQGYPLQYLEVAASGSFALLFDYPGVPAQLNLRSTSLARFK